MDPREVIFHQLKPTDCVVVHDVGPVTHPEFYAPKVETTYQMVFAKIRAIKPSLIFVTESARQEFIGLFGDDFPAMDVISPPLRAGLLDGPAEPPPGVKAPFLLTVGAIGTRKNQARAVQAYAVSGLAARGFGYVLCGGPEPGFEAVVAVADQTAGVVRPGYVTDANLRWLYLNASGFVLPSLLEGFGLPAAEAIAYGLVPLVSAGGALHEVTGDAAILVDPLDVGMIAEGMKKLVGLSDLEKSERLQSLKVSVARFTVEAAMGTWKAVLGRLVD
jgi:glycosyltransferase involved in cell wall biosynthesis